MKNLSLGLVLLTLCHLSLAEVRKDTSAIRQAPDVRNAWHCDRRPTERERKACEQARDAKPFSYEIRSAAPGEGNPLCNRLLENLRAFSEPPSCGLKIAPRNKEFFEMPAWEHLDPWADLDYLWKIDLLATSGVIGQRPIDALNREQWLSNFKKRNYEYDLEVMLRRARMDLNGDGRDEWVLAYQRSPQTCNPWALRGASPHLFVLKEDGRTIDVAMDPHRSRLSNQEPFHSNIPDARFPGARTYRFYNTGGVQYSVRGSATTASPSTVTACRFELIKRPGTLKKPR